ncbi:MAG: hypothetical protein R3E86_22240 [Pseudomonadales bacterium]
MGRFFRIFILPGAILQSVNIGGGYGTGRELVEFFSRHGMGNGLMGMGLATTLMSVTFATALLLSRRFEAYDYRSFFKVLLGRGWFLFELLGVSMFVLVLAVMGAAAGQIINAELGASPVIGGMVMLFAVVTLNFFGRDLVTRALAMWSFVLYAVFIAYFLTVMSRYADAADFSLLSWHYDPAWVVSGFQYALYNVSAIPVILYAARAIETDRQAIAAGLAGGLITMFPALLFHLSFLGAYPDIVRQELPVYAMFATLSAPVLQSLYLVVLVGTFIETGAGNIQGVIERLDGWWRERRGVPLTRTAHAGVAAAALLCSGALSAFGVVALIADGYGTLAWGYLVIFIIPLFTIGIYRLRNPEAST